MGCFNLNCSVSGLPIVSGTEIRAFMVAKTQTPIFNEAENVIFETENIFVPISTGIKGYYNDYGGINSCEASYSFELSARHYFSDKCDEEFDAEHFIDSVLDSFNKPECVVRFYNDNHVCYADIAFIREDIFQKLLTLRLDYTKFPTKLITNFSIPDEQILKELQKIKAAADAGNNNIFGRDLEGMRYLGLLFDLSNGESLFRFQSGFRPYREKFFSFFREQNEPSAEIITMARDISEFIQLNRVMGPLGKVWLPRLNLIGQQAPFDLAREFHGAVLDIANRELSSETLDNQDDIEEVQGFDTPKSFEP